MQIRIKTQTNGVQFVKRDCAQIVRRRLISIGDYRKIQNISIRLTCKDHDKRLELYCTTHDVAVCLSCIPSRHSKCSDVIPLHKAAENALRSTALAGLEDTLTGTLQNLEQIITDRESALGKYESQKQTIKNTINDTRARIQNKLDELEQKLLRELDTKYEYLKSEAKNNLKCIKKSKQDFSCMTEQTSKLKLFASDIQLFLGTRQMIETVFKEVESIKKGSKSLQNYDINIQLHPTIMALMNEIGQLGNISIKKTATSLSFKEARVDQAQIQLCVPDTKHMYDVRLQLKRRFYVNEAFCGIDLTECAMLSNGNMLIADYLGRRVILEYIENGKCIREIPCYGYPFDLTVIENDLIAVTYGTCRIVILKIENNISKKTFRLFRKNCYGISYQDSKLVIIANDGIVIINIAGKVLKKLKVESDKYLVTAKDRIYFTVERDHTVHCLSMDGEEIWVHKVESLVLPTGITVDDDQNVFIVDEASNSLIVIQHDGKSSRTLLSKADGLIDPIALHYNTDKKMLLKCDEKRFSLYNLMYLSFFCSDFSLNIELTYEIQPQLNQCSTTIRI